MAIKNMKSFQKRLAKRLEVNPVTNAKRAVTQSTMVVRSHAVQSIIKGGTGRTYEKYNPRRTHTASKEGEPPASDTGFLVSQITTNVKGTLGGTIVGQIISAAPYSKHLEFGTTDMMPRPFLQPALDKNKDKIVSIFTREGIIR